MISPDNVITRTSKNLRGIATHSHRHGKPEVTITAQRDGSAQCYLRWSNVAFQLRQCPPGGGLLLNPLIEGDSPCLRCMKTWQQPTRKSPTGNPISMYQPRKRQKRFS